MMAGNVPKGTCITRPKSTKLVVKWPLSWDGHPTKNLAMFITIFLNKFISSLIKSPHSLSSTGSSTKCRSRSKRSKNVLINVILIFDFVELFLKDILLCVIGLHSSAETELLLDRYFTEYSTSHYSHWYRNSSGNVGLSSPGRRPMFRFRSTVL